MKKILLCAALGAIASTASILAQNYDESKVGEYTLPELLEFSDGRKVRKKDWPERRQEILDMYQREMYGQMPPAPEAVICETFEEGITLGGFATRKQVRMWFKNDKTGPTVDWLIVTPNHVEGPYPTIMLLNYEGNQTVLKDEEIAVEPNWLRNDGSAFIEDHKSSEENRGMLITDPGRRNILPAHMLVAQGYAVVTACYGDISPDPTGADFAEDGTPLQKEFAYTGIFDLWGERDPERDDNTTSLAAWGWTLMRGMDMVEQDPELDQERVVLTGYSRLAKAALVAGAFDERFPVVVLNQTGGGGVPLHKRYFGENVEIMAKSFTHWYCPAYAKYSDNEAAMPFDQHMLLACFAPRALMVQGFNDPWYDTKGEFLAVQAASPAWELLGEEGLPDVDWPEDYDKSAIGPKLAYYHRDQSHGIAAIDWVWMIEFADKVFGRR